MENGPATKADLKGLETRLGADIKDLDSRLSTQIQDLDSRLSTQIQDLDSRLSTKIQDLDSRLSTKIQDLDSRLSTKIQDLETKLSTDITKLSTDIKDLESRIEGRMDVQQQRNIEQVRGLIHDSETRLLQAFYGFAEATNKRFNQIDGNIGLFFNRLGTVENRLLELEKRLNIPPTTQ